MSTLQSLKLVLRTAFSQSLKLSTINREANRNLTQFKIQNFQYSSYTGKNKVKITRPETVPVTKANKHLEINLYDENDVSVGVMSMENANKMAQEKSLKLTIIDENQNPPKFRLMTGNELYKLQMEMRPKIKEEKLMSRMNKEKEIALTFKSSDHDLEHKIKHAKEFFEKGYAIIFRVEYKMSVEVDDDQKKLKILQEEFKKKLQSKIDFSTFSVRSANNKEMLIGINSKEKQAKKTQAKDAQE